MKNSNLPSRTLSIKMLDMYHVPVHIKKHCIAVARFGVRLAEQVKESGTKVNIELVERAGLLHDLLRVCDIKQKPHGWCQLHFSPAQKVFWHRMQKKYRNVPHEDAAYLELRHKYPELARTIRTHRYLAIIDSEHAPKTWEQKIVYYADKRIMHEEVVPLAKRLKDGHKRNNPGKSKTSEGLEIEYVDSLIFELEKQIYNQIGQPTDSLIPR